MRRIPLGKAGVGYLCPWDSLPLRNPSLPVCRAVLRCDSPLAFGRGRHILCRLGYETPLRNSAASCTGKLHLEGIKAHGDNRSRPSRARGPA